MLIAEDLLLLLTDDTSGRLSTHPAKVEILLAGANLVELALMGHVHVSPEEVKPIPFRSPTGDAVLDAIPPMVIACEGNISCVISQPGKNLQRTLYERLVSSGLIRQRRRILAVLKVDRWPAQDSRHKVEVRQRVIQAVEENTPPDPRSAALIALLHTIEHEPAIVDPRHATLWDQRAFDDLEPGIIRKQLLKRGEEIANSDWAQAPETVRNSIGTIIAATRKLAVIAGERRSGGGWGGGGYGGGYFGDGGWGDGGGGDGGGGNGGGGNGG